MSNNLTYAKSGVNISSADKLVLNDFLTILKSKDNIKMEIGGHADKGTGDDFVNDNFYCNNSNFT